MKGVIVGVLNLLTKSPDPPSSYLSGLVLAKNMTIVILRQYFLPSAWRFLISTLQGNLTIGFQTLPSIVSNQLM